MARSRRSKFQKLINNRMTWPVVGGTALLVGALFVFSTFSGAGIFSKAQLSGFPGMGVTNPGTGLAGLGNPGGMGKTVLVSAGDSGLVGTVSISADGKTFKDCKPECKNESVPVIGSPKIVFTFNKDINPIQYKFSWSGTGSCATDGPNASNLKSTLLTGPFADGTDCSANTEKINIPYVQVSVAASGATDHAKVKASFSGSMYKEPDFTKDCPGGKCDQKVTAGSRVNVTVTVDPGYYVQYWVDGDGKVLATLLDSYGVSPLTKNITIKPQIALKKAYKLTIERSVLTYGGIGMGTERRPVYGAPVLVTGDVEGDKISCVQNGDVRYYAGAQEKLGLPKGTVIDKCSATGKPGENSFHLNVQELVGNRKTAKMSFDCTGDISIAGTGSNYYTYPPAAGVLFGNSECSVTQ